MDYKRISDTEERQPLTGVTPKDSNRLVKLAVIVLIGLVTFLVMVHLGSQEEDSVFEESLGDVETTTGECEDVICVPDDLDISELTFFPMNDEGSFHLAFASGVNIFEEEGCFVLRFEPGFNSGWHTHTNTYHAVILDGPHAHAGPGESVEDESTWEEAGHVFTEPGMRCHVDANPSDTDASYMYGCADGGPMDIQPCDESGLCDGLYTSGEQVATVSQGVGSAVCESNDGRIGVCFDNYNGHNNYGGCTNDISQPSYCEDSSLWYVDCDTIIPTGCKSDPVFISSSWNIVKDWPLFEGKTHQQYCDDYFTKADTCDTKFGCLPEEPVAPTPVNPPPPNPTPADSGEDDDWDETFMTSYEVNHITKTSGNCYINLNYVECGQVAADAGTSMDSTPDADYASVPVGCYKSGGIFYWNSGGLASCSSNFPCECYGSDEVEFEEIAAASINGATTPTGFSTTAFILVGLGGLLAGAGAAKLTAEY